MPGLVNEKTLELNISHELMNILGVQFYGTTQHVEKMTGVDVLYCLPFRNPVVIQYKCAKKGIDGQHCFFKINNNKAKNQHILLDILSKSGQFDAFYYFPMVRTDRFLISNFGNLLSHTFRIDPKNLTGSLSWNNQTHDVEVWNNSCIVHSEDYSGKGYEKFEDIYKLKNKLQEEKPIETNLGNYIYKMKDLMNKIASEYNIYRESEHTFIFFFKNIKNDSIGYIQIPLRIVGKK
jgi:hypothetical protein